MTKRRAKFKRHSGKMIKLYKDLFLIFFIDNCPRKPAAAVATSSMARVGHKLKLLLVLAVIFSLFDNNATMNTSQALQHQSRVQLSSSAQNQQASSVRSRRLNESPVLGQSKFGSASGSLDDQEDPMEPCYLANNRASETLTISESTPVGTIVGELLVSNPLHHVCNRSCLPSGHGHGLSLPSERRNRSSHLDQ